MSFDDGSQDMTSEADFSHRMAAILDEYQVGFGELCERAHLDRSTAMEAIERGSNGLPGTMNTLQQLLAPLNLDVSILICPTPIEPKTPQERRRALRTKLWNFIIRKNVPKDHRRRFVDAAISTLQDAPRDTMKLAARNRTLRTMTDIAYFYNELVQRGILD